MDTSAPTVVKLSTPADILGMLPYRLGFVPTESLVVVCLEGPRRRDRLVMRVDLEAVEHDKQLADYVAAHVARAGANAAIIVCYTAVDSEPDAGSGEPLTLPRRHLVDTVVDTLARRDIGVVEALLVSGQRWWSYHCSNPVCCPATGSDLPPELTAAAAHYAAEHVASGGVLLANREELERSVQPARNPVADAVRAQAADAAHVRMLVAFLSERPGAMCRLTVELLDEVAGLWSEGARELDANDAATLLAGLHDKRVRDHAMTLLLDYDHEMLLDLFTHLARAADDDAAAPVSTVVAWIAYASGNGGLANVAVERALTCDPDYTMAQLIEQGLASMIPPNQVLTVTRQVRDDLSDEVREEVRDDVPDNPVPPYNHRRRRRRGSNR